MGNTLLDSAFDSINKSVSISFKICPVGLGVCVADEECVRSAYLELEMLYI